MAATLCFLQLPLLPPAPNHHHHHHRPSSSLRFTLTATDPITPRTTTSTTNTTSQLSQQQHSPQELLHQTVISASKSAALPLLPLAFPFFLDPKDAVAVDGQFGLLEGRTISLVHPLVMAGLFLYTLYAGYLGWQWRRVRTIQTEINELKKQVQPVPVSSAGTPPSQPPQPSPVELQIQQLTEERKQLIKGQYRDRHYDAGSLLLGFGVFESVFGALNTWFRSGKLFPGPHLFAGAGITVLWAAAASLVPAMQKGNETARNLHIALNALNVILFIWQIPTGIDIVVKVLEFTNWP